MLSLKNIKEFIIITVGIFIAAVGVFFFMIPSAIPTGGISGISLVLSNLLPLSISTISLVLNIFLLIIGYIFIGKDFGLKTVYTSLLLPILLGVFEKMFPNFTSILGDPVYDMVVSLFVIGIGQTLLFNAGASSGGLDIVGKLLNKYLRMDLGKAMSTSGLAASLTAVFCYDLKTVVFALLGTYLSGVILDHFLFGTTERKRVCIISGDIESMTKYILHDLDAGATLYEAKGAYDGKVKYEIITILDKNKYKLLMDHISKNDPSAFVTVTPIHEVYTAVH
ncbi:MAG: YitT family protein [Clostridia bacterium]|nr:YitT family protein [Clostridia bacterium]